MVNFIILFLICLFFFFLWLAPIVVMLIRFDGIEEKIDKLLKDKPESEREECT
jgi:hypothetical protein